MRIRTSSLEIIPSLSKSYMLNVRFSFYLVSQRNTRVIPLMNAFSDMLPLGSYSNEL